MTYVMPHYPVMPHAMMPHPPVMPMMPMMHPHVMPPVMIPPGPPMMPPAERPAMLGFPEPDLHQIAPPAMVSSSSVWTHPNFRPINDGERASSMGSDGGQFRREWK